VAPVCSNCGASDFVWANDLKTGSGGLGGGSGSLSLRPKGELSMGTRICRACGHADLFLKDPSILRTPHAWKPGEFVPIPTRSSTPAAGSHHHSGTAPTASPPPPAPPPTAPMPAPAPPPPTPPSPTPIVPAPMPAPPTTDEPMLEPAPSAAGSEATGADTGSRRPSRRKSKSKSSEPPAGEGAPPA
jgi:hypothetical protein